MEAGGKSSVLPTEVVSKDEMATMMVNLEEKLLLGNKR